MRIEEVNEEMSRSSICRMTTFNEYKPPKCKQDVINMLSDSSNSNYPVFRDSPRDHVQTIAVGEIEITLSLKYRLLCFIF